MRRAAALVAALAVLASPGRAAGPAAHAKAGEATPAPPAVSVPFPDVVKLAPGERAEARVEVVVREGFHVQANPASWAYLVPLRLELQSAPTVRAGKPIYPRGVPYRLQGASSDLMTYAGTVEVRVPISASKKAFKGRVRLGGALHYQACDDRICLRPASVPVMLFVDVETQAGRSRSEPSSKPEGR